MSLRPLLPRASALPERRFAVLLLLAYAFLSVPRVGQSQQITEFSIPAASAPYAITSGPDGNLWFTQIEDSKIGRITPTGTFTMFPIPVAGGFFHVGLAIVTGPDGALWFDNGGAGIGRLTTTGVYIGYRTSFSLTDLVVGPDQNLWFTEASGNLGKIGRLTPAGVLTEADAPPGDFSTSTPDGITKGPDGALWYLDSGGNQIVRVTTEFYFTVFKAQFARSGFGIAEGPDLNLWFTSMDFGRIGKMTTSGALSDFFIAAGSRPFRITLGPDGALWFTDVGLNQIGRVTTEGVINEIAAPSNAGAVGITTGPDQAIWFTERGANKIGRLSLPAISVSVPTLSDMALVLLGMGLAGFGLLALRSR